ncbi:MAG: molybdopterin-guanine dinucleotide biosynthesis protein MobB [Gammaproteobacteria bacterium]|jgi:molybdopterin-guanine dinucleotide biosynthesis protein MobB
MVQSTVPIFGFSAYSGTGKTTLLKQLIPLLIQKGLRIAVIKHSHHDFDLDVPGKDSYELRKSGASRTIICSSTRMATIDEFTHPEDEPPLQDIISNVDRSKFDLILVEGYKPLSFPKIELHRHSLGKPYLFPQDDSIEAIASDEPVDDCDLEQLDINNVGAIAEFIYTRFFG